MSIPERSEFSFEGGFDPYTIILDGLCDGLLKNKIPEKLRVSLLAKKTIEEALELQGLEKQVDSSMLWTSDNLTDEVPSYRLRLVPRELYRGIKYNDSEIKSLVINIPEPFVKDTDSLSGIGLSLISLQLDNGDSISTCRFAITKTQIVPYDEFSKLDFEFIEHDDDGGDFEMYVNSGDNEVEELKLHDQVEIARLVDRMLSGEYVIASQSRRDGTIWG